jgi:NDP-mannose synthase
MATTLPKPKAPSGQRRLKSRVVVLAGGRGTRLAPLTTVLPKPLMPLAGQPILDVLLGQLRQQGWREATISIGYLGNMIKLYYGTGAKAGVRLRYLEEESPLGTVGPLALLGREEPARPLMVMNGDLLTTLRFANFARAHAASGALASVAVKRRSIEMEFGVLDLGDKMGPQRRVTGYREKPMLEETVSMGVYMFEPEILDYISPGERLDLPELVHRLLRDGRQVGAYPFDGYWLDIGRHSDYQAALDDFERLRPMLLRPDDELSMSPGDQRASAA